MSDLAECDLCGKRAEIYGMRHKDCVEKEFGMKEDESKERDTITEYEWQDFVLALPLTMRPRFALLKEMHERLLQAPSFWEGESDRLNKELCEKDVEIMKLKEELRLAVKYLKEGKAKFAPSTTNSFVDDFIAKHEDKVSGPT